MRRQSHPSTASGTFVGVRRSAKVFLTPGWIAVHVLVLVGAVTMVLLGRWQLQVSDDKRFNLQNFGYALQWWAFSAFAIAVWLKAIRDTWSGRSAAPSTSGELVLRGGPGTVVYVGPAELVAPNSDPGQAPVTYRGYVMPQSTTSPARTDGDPVRGAYNDYLWQLALADSANERRPARLPVNEPDPAGVISPRPEIAGHAGTSGDTESDDHTASTDRAGPAGR